VEIVLLVSCNMMQTLKILSVAKKNGSKKFLKNLGRLIAQAVSRWLPTAAAQVRARVWQVGFVVEKVSLG
jgi:hypothetical protein